MFNVQLKITVRFSGVAQVVQHLPNKLKALGSSPKTEKKKQPIKQK
jgi:hypothetical protein